MAAKKNFYVVWRGQASGIFESWELCKMQVEGFKGAQYKGYATREEAERAYAGGYENSVEKKDSTAKKPRKKCSTNIPTPIPGSVSVDAACSGNPGTMEYRGVLTDTGQEIFHSKIYHEATNNIGEYLAVVHALALIAQGKLKASVIYSDSLTARAWLRAKRCKSKLVRTEVNAPVFELVARADAWLQNNEVQTKVLKWPTEIWGEIPADFGRK